MKRRQRRAAQDEPVRFIFNKPDPPEQKCKYCGDPVYFYECQDPPICLWCEKQMDDFLEGRLNVSEQTEKQ